MSRDGLRGDITADAVLLCELAFHLDEQLLRERRWSRVRCNTCGRSQIEEQFYLMVCRSCWSYRADRQAAAAAADRGRGLAGAGIVVSAIDYLSSLW